MPMLQELTLQQISIDQSTILNELFMFEIFLWVIYSLVYVHYQSHEKRVNIFRSMFIKNVLHCYNAVINKIE